MVDHRTLSHTLLVVKIRRGQTIWSIQKSDDLHISHIITLCVSAVLQVVYLRTNHDNMTVIIVYSIGMMTIKYREGYSLLPGYGSTHVLRYHTRSWKLTYIHLPVIPTPYQLWTPTDQALLMKFYLIFAVAWGLEMCRNTPLVC